MHVNFSWTEKSPLSSIVLAAITNMPYNLGGSNLKENHELGDTFFADIFKRQKYPFWTDNGESS